MDFHLEFTPRNAAAPLQHHHRLMLIGSCFTENIGSKLRQFKFSVLENPHGILFNPVSIAVALRSYIARREYQVSELFYFNECWHSWDHHSRFSHPEMEESIRMINESQQAAHLFLKKADRLIITLGSAFGYALHGLSAGMGGTEGAIVANCHKVPTDKFRKQLLTVDETEQLLHQVLEELFVFNPGIRVIFTISPVRHLRDGFVENNRSKSTLIQAVHRLCDKDERLEYFPAYELVIDDLRDYRFYAEDLVHPNYAATNYVWEKFVSSFVHEDARKLMNEINVINAARSHRPFNPASSQHRQFLQTHFDKTLALEKLYPYIDFAEEKRYFSLQP